MSINSNQILHFQVDQKIKTEILEKISKFKNKKVLVLGDVGVDEYIMGSVKRISPEAPVPVLDVQEEDKRLGLAANVAQNVKSLGGEPILVSVVGSDAGADILNQLLSKAGVKSDYLIVDSTRPTTRKTRVMTGHHHLVRVDHEVRKNLSLETENILIQKLESIIDQVDCIVLEDYAKGIFSNSMVEKIVALSKSHKKYLMVDPHQTKFAEFYKGVDLIKPNYNEALALTQIHEEDIENSAERVLVVGRQLQKMTGASDVVLTQGKDGMAIFSKNEQVIQVPTFAKKVFDVTGAGDTVIAALALGVSSGMSLAQSCVLANYAAGIVVAKIGCVPCELQELLREIGTL
jgi:D-glycero-beta-D-manno-heptose-7-phosphate kinase